jgi:ADP-ribosylation factor GTPase-activating protein 1
MSLCLNKAAEGQLRALPGNNVCCDCNDKQPQWASVSFGVFMCLECSGRHRALGVHISFVRSVSMDSWSEKQIKMMKSGGNDKCNEFLKGHSVPKTMAIPQKYNTPAAELYRDRLSAEVEGRPLPTELKAPSSNVIQGSDPLPGESEKDYVARQRKLQEEARERMRQKFGTSSGLSSGGKMTAMGSDSSYRPGQTNNNSMGGIPIDLSEVSKNAFSFLQDSAKLIGTNVAKLAEQPVGGNNGSTEDGGWGAFAGSIWQQAAAATSDLVKQATESEDTRFPRPDDGFKFPRPADAPSSSTTTGNNKYAGFGSTTSSSGSTGRNVSSNSSKDSSWDDLGDILNAGQKKDPARGNGGHVRANSGSSGGGSGKSSGYVSSGSANSLVMDSKGGSSRVDSQSSSERSLSSLNKLSLSDPSPPSPSPSGSDGIASSSRYASGNSLNSGESSGGGSSRKKMTTKLKIDDGEDNWDTW